jgi:hypothetical protein
VTSFEPLTLLSALAMVTERIGLVATAFTSFEEPFCFATILSEDAAVGRGPSSWRCHGAGCRHPAGGDGVCMLHGLREGHCRRADGDLSGLLAPSIFFHIVSQSQALSGM